MQSAEQGFVDSLDKETLQKIIDAIGVRLLSLKSAKQALCKASVPKATCATQDFYSISSIACQPCAMGPEHIEYSYYVPSTTTAGVACVQEAPQQKGQKEDTMSDLEVARRHMDNRLYSIKNTKRAALKTQFGLANMLSPLTFADMKARLLAGQFTLPSDEDQEWGVGLDCLNWRDPSVKMDRPGFDVADKALDAAAVKVKDAIWVKANAEDALALLEAFESSTTN